MGKKKNKKLVAFFMSTLMLLSSTIGYFPAMVQAAETKIVYATADTVLDTTYRYTFKTKSSTSKSSIWGAKNSSSLMNKIDPNNVVSDNRYYVDLTTATAGSFGMLYKDVGDYKGQALDLKLTIQQWGSAKGWIDKTNNTKGNPTAILYRNKIDVGILGVNWVRTKFTFVKSGTNTKVDIKGHLTLSDVDGLQKVRFPKSPDCGISQAFILKGSNHLKVNDNVIEAADVETNDDDYKAWITAFFDRNDIFMDFYRGDRGEEDGRYPCWRDDTERITPPHFGFDARALGKFPYDAPVKRVGKKGVAYGAALDDTKAEKGTPYKIPGTNGKSEFNYIIAQKLSPNKLSKFEMKDVLENPLTYVSMKVTNDSGTDVTKQFNVTTSGQTVKAAAKAEYLSQPDFTANVTYYFRITVKRNTKVSMEQNGDWFVVPNKAQTTITYAEGSKETDTKETKAVWAGYTSTPVSLEGISKEVGAKGTSWDDADACDEATVDSAYRINEYELYDYLVQAPLDSPDNEIKTFRIQDTLEECLDIDNVNKVSITDKDDKVVTSKFDVKIEEDTNGKKTITCTATAEALADAAFRTGQTYTVHMTVHRKRAADIKTSMKEWLLDDGYTFIIPNSATAYIKGSAGDGDEKTVESNTSYVWDTIRSDLKIEKTCIPYDGWEVGSEVEYAVKVSQVRQDGYAVNVEAWDYDLPEGLKLVPGSITVTDTSISDGSVANVMPEGTNGWRATCPRMQYGDYFVVSFRAKADDTVNGIDTINTAYATADNFINKDDEKQEISDSAEAWVNTPNLTIDKYMDRYEHEVGDIVKYTVVVNNINDYTVAKNVVVSDLSLPMGMRLQEGSSVNVSFSPDSAMNSVGWPVADGTEVIKKEPIPNTVEIDEHNNTWTVRSKYLSSDASMTIDFTCVAEEEINGLETANQANVTANNAAKDENGNPVISWDDAKVYVNTSDLTIDKTASQYEWEVDDIVDYQIVVSNQDSAAGTIARNVLIKDVEIPQGLLLEDINQVMVNGVPVTIVDKISGPQDIPNQLDEEYYNSTQEKDNTYELAAEGTGFAISIPNLPQGEVVTIDFPCRAVEVAAGDDSWEWINKASVTADNQRGHETEEDDAEIYINTANMTIDKSMTNVYYNPDAEDYDNREPYEFRVGEDVQYQLTVNNIQRNSVARNVVIKDITLPSGYALAGEVVVEGYQGTWRNPIAGTPDTANQLDENHYKETETLDFAYQIDYITNEDGSTGFTVSIPNLPCTTGDILNPEWNTPLTITYHCIADDTVNGNKIINTAVVTADNAGEKKDSEMVWINSPKLQVEKKSDRDNYKIGDVITYEVTATQNQIGAVARNVYFEDILLTEGVKLQKNSIVLMDETGAVIDDDDYVVEIYNDHFTLQTLRPLICPAGNYPLADLDKNGQIVDGGAYNPLGITKEQKMTIEYQAIAEDDNLTGQTVNNKITINSDEKIPDEDEEQVPINSPVLNIEKTSDKEHYNVGETGIYKLVVTQLREDVTALNVRITDALQTEGAKIIKDSLVMEYNGKEFKPAAQEVTDTGFTIQTGKDLTDQDKIEIVYKVLFESASLNGKKVKNTATAQGDNTPKEEQENVVEVTDLVPALAIEKTSDKQEYKIGETGHYTVVVSQTREGATARNVIIKDALQITGARILPETIVIKNSAGTSLKKPEIDATALGYTIHTGSDLAYGEFFTVTYDVLFEDESLSGQSILNIARATANNAEAETSNDVTTPVPVGDGLTALKTCEPENGSVVKNSETITYHITVNNTSNSAKECVLVKDKVPVFTEFVKIAGAADNAAITDKVQIDQNTSGQYLVIDQNGYAAFILNNLAAGESRTVSFVVKVTGAAEDDMIVNVAHVRETVAQEKDITEETWKSDRFNPTNETIHFLDTKWTVDTNTVTVPNPELTISKSSDKTSYSVGDTGTYTLTVTQQKEGAVSKNVVISDTIETEGVELVANSIQVTNSAGEVLKDAKITAEQRSFTVETGADLRAGEKLLVTYKVLFKEKSLNGTTVHNVALAKDDTTKPGEEPSDDNDVEIGDAVLVIEKTSDKYEYSLGETGKYTLVVSNKSKEVVANNVVITDTLANKNVELDAGSIEITDADGVPVKKAEIIAEDHGFTIQTHSDLAYGEKFIVTYHVRFKNSKLVGHDVKNTAKAKADNTDKVDTSNKVTVTGDDKKDIKPTATPTPTPKVTAKATPAAQRGTTTSTTTSNGTTSGGGKTATPVKTGDETPIGLYVVILVVGIGGIAGAVAYRRRKSQKNRKNN